MPAAAEHDNDTASNVGMGSGRTVMTFDISMHQSDTASLGVTVHVSSSLSTRLCDSYCHTHRERRDKTRHLIVQRMLILEYTSSPLYLKALLPW